MQIAYLGLGAWGFTLAHLLASKGYKVVGWTNQQATIDAVAEKGCHPFFPDVQASKNLVLTKDLSEALKGADMIVESVTLAGIRPVFDLVKEVGIPDVPIVFTSKGIEQETGLLSSDIVSELLGTKSLEKMGSISGPSYADDVVRSRPTSVVASARSKKIISLITEAFTTKTFRVYPNSDTIGVAYGGALKNIIAIACGACNGLSLGESAKAALMTRGLHEMCKLAVAAGANRETLYGLSGMGDLCVTCASTTSRNFRFGKRLAEGAKPEEIKKEIGMVVEGAYTAVSALQISKKLGVSMPIAEGVFAAIYKDVNPLEVMHALMGRDIKEEHL